MKLQTRVVIGLSIGIAMAIVTGSAHAACKSAHGRIVSELVTEFSDGTPCPPPLGLLPRVGLPEPSTGALDLLRRC
jgi:hypothetical protein